MWLVGHTVGAQKWQLLSSRCHGDAVAVTRSSFNVQRHQNFYCVLHWGNSEVLKTPSSC